MKKKLHNIRYIYIYELFLFFHYSSAIKHKYTTRTLYNLKYSIKLLTITTVPHTYCTIFFTEMFTLRDNVCHKMWCEIRAHGCSVSSVRKRRPLLWNIEGYTFYHNYCYDHFHG